jgi:hypothetical protein
MRRKHYPPPLPPKRQVQAHLAFFASAKRGVKMSSKIKWSEIEKRYLQRLVSADYQRMNANMDHAVSHGSEIMLPDFDVAGSILEKLEQANNENSGA